MMQALYTFRLTWKDEFLEVISDGVELFPAFGSGRYHS